MKIHHYISKQQSKFFKNIKLNLNEEECIIVADFSENYHFKIQDEVQGHHWDNTQATVHPFILYAGQPSKPHCYAVISDNLKHDTVAFYTFQKKLLELVKLEFPVPKKIYYFSDGCVAQYKNRKNFINISEHESDFNFKCEWHFFATAHGKTACDGVGGTVKRLASKASLQRHSDHHILNSQDLLKFCEEHVKG